MTQEYRGACTRFEGCHALALIHDHICPQLLSRRLSRDCTVSRYGCGVTTALLTDKYELTMLVAALRDGTAHRRTTFEVFARRLPEGRRYGVVAGTARFVEALGQFRFDEVALATLSDFLDPQTLAYLADYQFRGDVDGYAEGELYFPGSPVLSVHGSFGECVLLETLALSIFNHDTAIASAAARMVSAAEGRRSGPRRLHRRLHRNLQPGGRATLPPAGAGHQRPRVHAAAHLRRRAARREGRVPGPGRRARSRHHAARRHLRHHRGGGQCRRGGRHRAWRGPHRLR